MTEPAQFYPVGSYPSYILSAGVDRWAMIIMGVLVVVGAIYCLIEARKQGSALPLVVLIGALTTVTLEPFFDVLGGVAHPSGGTTEGLTLLNRPMPVYNALIYIFYWSGTVVYLIDRIRKGITVRGWLTLTGVLMASALVFELIPIHFGMWMYYNNQPFNLLGFPLWWAFVNTHAAIGLAVAIHLLAPLLKGARLWLLVPMFPGLLFGIHMFAAFPGYATVASTPDGALTLFGTGLTMVLSWVYAWIYALIVATDGYRRPAATAQ